MKLDKYYRHTKYSINAISLAIQEFKNIQPHLSSQLSMLECGDGDTTWRYDTYEEFLVEYPSSASYHLTIHRDNGDNLTIHGRHYGPYDSCSVIVNLPKKEQIEKLTQIFESGNLKSVYSNVEKKVYSKKKYYPNLQFPTGIIEEVYKKFLQRIGNEQPDNEIFYLIVNKEEWELPNIEEFLADYNKAEAYGISINHGLSELKIDDHGKGSVIRISDTSRDKINSFFNIFEHNRYTAIIKKVMQEFRIFIGHGRDIQWKELKDHLYEKHHYQVDHFEIGATAGYTIKEVLNSKLKTASIALLVFTGEDKDDKGLLHPRENVIHELGLFQGRLGFSKAIVLLEEGIQEFSNIHGIQQLRFTKNNIKEIFGDVIAVINRERPE